MHDWRSQYLLVIRAKNSHSQSNAKFKAVTNGSIARTVDLAHSKMTCLEACTAGAGWRAAH